MITAWIMGIFGSLREYAVPSYLLTSLGMIAALAREKRWDALWGFSGIFAIFFFTLLGGWIELSSFVLFRSSQSQYFHSLSEWFPHVISYAIGIPLTILLTSISFLLTQKICYYVHIELNIELKKNTTIKDAVHLFVKKINGLHIIFITNVILLILYSLLILMSSNRVVRPVIMPMFSLINILLIGIKIVKVPNTFFSRKLTRMFCILLIISSWSMTYYQLLIAFDGGKTFAHPAYGLEYYNHPLYLRKLSSENDMHVE